MALRVLIRLDHLQVEKPNYKARSLDLLVGLSREKPAEKDRLAVYNTGLEVLIGGVIVLVIGVMFQFLEANITSRVPTGSDLPNWMQHLAWIFWVAPVCYLVSAPVLAVGVFLLYRAYRQLHLKDRRQMRLTPYDT